MRRNVGIALGCLLGAAGALSVLPARAGRHAAGAPAAAAAAPGPAAEPAPAAASPGVLDLPAHTEWESFTRRDGLPSDHVFAVRIDGDRVWAGTTAGLALYEGGRWRTYGTADGLPYPVVLSLDVSPRTGDLWIGTMGGLARLSAGRFDVFTQKNSGLGNDFVHAVRCDPDEDAVWAATAMGACRYDLRDRSWTCYDHTNTPMHEPWTYAVGISGGRVYVGAWGGGVLEMTKATGVWREYRDPDKQFDLDLLPDDGPVSDVTSGLDYSEGILWAGSYVGLARYDGRNWRSFYQSDSGLAGDFVNFVRSQGRLGWMATDQGVSVTDGDGWVTYRRLDDGRGEVRTFEGARALGRQVLPSGPVSDDVLGLDAKGDDLWIATAGGVSHALRAAGARPARHAVPPVPAGAPRAGAATAPLPEPHSADGRFRYAGEPERLLPYRGHLPYKQFFTERTRYRGPGRDDPPSASLQAVRIGFIGPLTGEDRPGNAAGIHPVVGDPMKAIWGRRMLRAATMAIDEANAEGGWRGVPFRLVTRTDMVLWGQTSNELARFAYEDDVVAILSSIDSNHNHVLSRATLKGEVPVVNAGSTDPTLVEHNIPWLARVIQDDRQQAYALLHEVFVTAGLSRVAVLRSSDRDGRTGIEEFLKGARRLGRPVVLEARFDVGERDFGDQLKRIAAAAPDGLVLWGGPRETGAAVRQARESGLAVPIFGYDRMAHPEFLETAGRAAEGVTAVTTLDPDRGDRLWTLFRDRYRARWGEEPDTYAAHAYDGMNLILTAVRDAGVNRARVRDRIYAVERLQGVSGPLILDTNMSDVAPVTLATVRDGRFVFRPAPAWEDDPAGAARAPAAAARETGR